MENEHWYAMYVKMHHEKKTAEKLYKMGVKHYLPLQETVKQWSDRIDKATHKPAIIRNEEMERFMFMLDYSENTVRFCCEPLKPGEKVEVIKGPLKGLKGELIDIDGKSQVSVRLEMLGYAMVEMPVGFLKKIEDEQL